MDFVFAMQNISSLASDINFPSTLVTAGLKDEVAPAWMATKWVAAMRSHVTLPSSLCLHMPPVGHSPDDESVSKLDAIDATWLLKHVRL